MLLLIGISPGVAVGAIEVWRRGRLASYVVIVGIRSLEKSLIVMYMSCYRTSK